MRKLILFLLLVAVTGLFSCEPPPTHSSSGEKFDENRKYQVVLPTAIDPYDLKRNKMMDDLKHIGKPMYYDKNGRLNFNQHHFDD